jgi:peptidoglycan-N-acetylglucosamine deacetylase
MFTWPDGAEGALSLTFDDGLGSHHEIAIPMLERHELRATFYVNPVGIEDDGALDAPWRERLERWRRASELGHEIGNHSLLHACSLNIDTAREWGDAAPSPREWDLARIAADLREAQRRIASAFTDQAATSFAYPCYESSVGTGSSRESYTPVVARDFVAGRAGGELSGALANDPSVCDLHLLSSYPVEHQQGELMIGLAERAAARGRWAIFTIHGINEGALSISEWALSEFLAHVARRADRFWVAPVAEVAGVVVKSRS